MPEPRRKCQYCGQLKSAIKWNDHERTCVRNPIFLLRRLQLQRFLNSIDDFEADEAVNEAVVPDDIAEIPRNELFDIGNIPNLDGNLGLSREFESDSESTAPDLLPADPSIEERRFFMLHSDPMNVERSKWQLGSKLSYASRENSAILSVFLNSIYLTGLEELKPRERISVRLYLLRNRQSPSGKFLDVRFPRVFV